MMDKEYIEATVANDIKALKTVCEGQTEAIKILKDEIVQLIKESEMHKEFIKNLFVQIATLTTMALPSIDVNTWNKLVEKTKNLGSFDKLYDSVKRETK